MKNSIFFLLALIFSSSIVVAQEVKTEEQHNYEHRLLANASVKFPCEIEVGGELLLHLNFPWIENPKWALAISLDHEMLEDTSTAFLLGLSRKFEFEHDVILETAILVGPEMMRGPKTHLRFGFASALSNKNFDVFATAEYGLMSGLHYKVHGLWFPAKAFGFGFESQFRTITGAIFAVRPIPNLWISFSNGAYVHEGNLQYALKVGVGYKFNIPHKE